MNILIGINNANSSKHFLSPYTVCIAVNGYFLEFGRGSFSATSSIRLYGYKTEDEESNILKIGQFVERNHTTSIIVGGEHLTDNKELINTFQTAEVIRASIKNRSDIFSRAHRKTIIEDNVVLSASTTILNGAHIRSNSLLAAGSITNKEHPPNSIIGGVPSKKIGDLKIPPVEWWNFSFDGIINFFNTGKLDQNDDPCSDIKIVFSASLTSTNSINKVAFSHLLVKGQKISISELENNQIDYLSGKQNVDGKFLVSDEIFNSLL